MPVSSQRTGILGGLLLSASMMAPPGYAMDVDSSLPGEFLEYLATLVDQDGEWVDALDLNEDDLPDEDARQTNDVEYDDLNGSAEASIMAAEQRRISDDNAE